LFNNGEQLYLDSRLRASDKDKLYSQVKALLGKQIKLAGLNEKSLSDYRWQGFMYFTL
jgi:hypothetical protein